MVELNSSALFETDVIFLSTVLGNSPMFFGSVGLLVTEVELLQESILAGVGLSVPSAARKSFREEMLVVFASRLLVVFASRLLVVFASRLLVVFASRLLVVFASRLLVVFASRLLVVFASRLLVVFASRLLVVFASRLLVLFALTKASNTVSFMVGLMVTTIFADAF